MTEDALCGPALTFLTNCLPSIVITLSTKLSKRSIVSASAACFCKIPQFNILVERKGEQRVEDEVGRGTQPRVLSLSCCSSVRRRPRLRSWSPGSCRIVVPGPGPLPRRKQPEQHQTVPAAAVTVTRAHPVLTTPPSGLPFPCIMTRGSFTPRHPAPPWQHPSPPY